MSEENKYNYLLKNIGLMTLSNFATKLLSFFLVPLYTSVLTTAEYGTYDLINTTISILIPIVTFNIYDAVFRFMMEKDRNADAVLTISFRLVLFGTLCVSGFVVLNHFFYLVPVIDTYALYFILMFISQAASGILAGYARGADHIADLSLSSVVTSFITITLNILFLAVMKFGIKGYFWANILGPSVQCAYLFFRLRIWKYLHIRKKYLEERKKMLTYSIPLVANAIAWWVNNASDRYVVTWFRGLSENGIYSVASKIPSILNILQTIFVQAWAISVVKDYDPEDRSGFFKNTYGLYNCVMVVGCSITILFDRMLARLLYANEFYVAWRYVPFLTIAIVFGALSGYLGGFFSAVKNSKIFARSTVLGAVFNLALNIILTPWIGALGAAIATAVSYFVVWGLRLYHSRKFIRLKISLKRDLLAYSILALQAVILLCATKRLFFLYGIETILTLINICLYRNEFIKIIIAASKKMRGGKVR